MQIKSCAGTQKPSLGPLKACLFGKMCPKADNGCNGADNFRWRKREMRQIRLCNHQKIKDMLVIFRKQKGFGQVVVQQKIKSSHDLT
jgi:hypothetical protein